MAIHVLSSAEQIGTQALDAGDYVIYEQHRFTDLAERWIASRCRRGGDSATEVLGQFPSKANALTFVLAHESTGCEDDGVLRRAAQSAIRHASSPLLSDALQQLGLALEATAPRRPRVLVVVDRGVARVYRDRRADVVIVDVDLQRELAADELQPVHTDYAGLLKRAGVKWPLSPAGRRCDPEWGFG